MMYLAAAPTDSQRSVGTDIHADLILRSRTSY